MSYNTEDKNVNDEHDDQNKGESVFSSINKDQPSISDEGVLSSIKYLQERRFVAVTTSLIMIGYAAESGYKLSQSDVKAILDMADAVDPKGKAVSENQITPDLESKFWEALSHISNLIKPATAVAIRERSDFLSAKSGGQKNAVFSSTIEFYKRYLWIALAITLIMHGYYFYLGAMIGEAKESIQRFDSARTAAFTAIASDKQNSPQMNSAIAINISSVCAALDSWRSSNEAISAANLHFGDAGLIKAMAEKPITAEAALCGKNDGADGSIPASNDLDKVAEKNDLNKVTENLNRFRVVDPVTQRVLSRGGRYLSLVDHFALPLLYGTLGALAYIIRSLSISIREIRYSRAFQFEQGLQIPLGALVGATVGLVVSPEALNTAFGLTVLGLAFGFGYSVDVFFALIDGLIGRIAQKQPQREFPPQGDATTKT